MERPIASPGEHVEQQATPQQPIPAAPAKRVAEQPVVQPLLVLRESIINGFFPIFARNLGFAFLYTLPIFFGLIILGQFNLITWPLAATISIYLFILVIVSIISISWKLIQSRCTKYYFYETHVVREFRFFVIKQYSVPYSEIINVVVDITVWDRICRAGNITINTADASMENFILRYVKDPETVKHFIDNLIIKHRTPAAQHQDSQAAVFGDVPKPMHHRAVSGTHHSSAQQKR